MITVKNANGTRRFEEPSTGEGSWIAYWETNKFTIDDSLDNYCPKCNSLTDKADFDGAHVKKESSEDSNYYIIPLCNSCNRSKDQTPFTVPKNLLCPVPSNL